jgi:CRP-like cAMP-binding protein
MSSNKLIHFLHSSNLVSLTSAQQIATSFKPKTINKNEYLLKAGQVTNEYLFLETGFLRSFAYDVAGNDITTAFYSGNQIVFEVSSYFSRTVAKENIQALTNCTGWYVTYSEFNILFHSLPEFREFGRSILVKGFSALKNRMLSMITETAEERYANLLRSNPEILQNAPLKNIATYLGITDTSLSRIRKELAHK